MVAIKARSSGTRDCLMLDRIFAVIAMFLFYEFYWKDAASLWDIVTEENGRVCAPLKGLVVVNLLGHLEYNVLQIGFARRMAEELCWDVAYRSMWNPGFNSPENECFPNALTPEVGFSEELMINGTMWKALNYRVDEVHDQWEKNNQMTKLWAEESSQDGFAWRCIHHGCNFSEDELQKLISGIRTGESSTRIIYLEDFFVHHEWMEQWRPKLKDWFHVKDSCCSHQPPPNAVVIHIHPATDQRRLEKLEMHGREYERLLAKYNLRANPIWIVCEQGCQNSLVVQDLITLVGAIVVHPQSPTDTLCILSQVTHTLVVTPNHMLSSVAATLSNAAVVHYPTPQNEGNRFALTVPEWKYHVVKNNKISKWDVKHDSLDFRTPWF